MNKSEANTQGWPMVPVNPEAIPEGYEPVRVGWPVEGELSCTVNREPHTWKLSQSPLHCVPVLIIRPIKPPIELPLSIVPSGWWVAMDEAGWVHLHEKETRFSAAGLSWVSDGQIWPLPPWIAEQLPAEWHELPWDKSAIQQTEGGEG